MYAGGMSSSVSVGWRVYEYPLTYRMSAGFSYLRKNYPIGKSYIRLIRKQHIHYNLEVKDENTFARL
jgi:hypothetical protein